jgi:hypothetical protein
MSEEHERLGEVVSRGFDRGNFANAYETQDYETALESLDMPRAIGGSRLPRALQDAYRAAFTLGFFGSYELHEMGSDVEAYREAYFSEGGKACLAAGYTDARDWESYERES